MSLISFAVFYGLFHAFQPSVQQQLQTASDDMNKKGPVMADKVTRLDSTSVGPMSFSYHYTVDGIPSENMSQAFFDTALRPGIVSKYRTGSELETFRNDGVTVNYIYSDPNGKQFAVITVGPEDLK
jgi:hypothetical protein